MHLRHVVTAKEPALKKLSWISQYTHLLAIRSVQLVQKSIGELVELM